MTTMNRCQSGRHDLTAVRLHRVQVAHPDAEQQAAQPVVHARHERLLVLALLGAGHDVRLACPDGIDESRNLGRDELEVRRIEHEDIAAGDLSSGAERVGDATTRPMPHRTQKRVLRPQRVEHRGGAVTAAVVHDDDLAGVRHVPQGIGARPHEGREVLGFVQGRHEYADVDVAAVRQAHTRLRIRAGRMPSCSRYLATVRRAI
jgi:hypothetical protein